MNSRNSHQSTRVAESVSIRQFSKEPTMSRLFTTLLSTLLVAIFALNATPAFAQDSTPSDVDTADRAYLQEYQQRAVEKYETMQATRAAGKAASAASAAPDWGGEMAVREYDERSRAVFAAVQQRSVSAVVNSAPDWGGEMFLAEYEQRGRERYRIWLAQQKSRLTGSASR